MKRDMDLIRQLLFQIEADNPELAVEGYDDKIVTKHLELLEEAGLIKAFLHKTDQSGVVQVDVERLTWEGYEFLDAARNEEVWNKTKAVVGEKSGSVTFEVLKSLLVETARSIIFGK